MMFAVFGVCIVLATEIVSSSQGQTYCERLPNEKVLQADDHCFFVLPQASTNVAMPKVNGDFIFNKSLAQEECNKTGAHLPKFSAKNMTPAQRNAFYNLTDTFSSGGRLNDRFPTSCEIKARDDQAKQLKIDCGFGEEDTLMSNAFDDNKEWSLTYCPKSTNCIIYYGQAGSGHNFVAFLATEVRPTTADTKIICHEIKKAQETAKPTDVTTTNPPASSATDTTPTVSGDPAQPAPGDTASTNGLGWTTTLASLMVVAAAFKM